MFRSIFVPDSGMVWGSPDYNQCLVAGTKVTVPGGHKNIEDMKPGDLVYSYDDQCRLVLRRVTWAGQTGMRSVCRLKWMTNGRTEGHLDCTPDHKIRLIDGSYKTVSEIAAGQGTGTYGRQTPFYVRTLALRRGPGSGGHDYQRNYLYITGIKKLPEGRFIFEQLHGWSPEHVHHIDGNSLNDDPSNLEGLTEQQHRLHHDVYGNSKKTKEERIAASRRATVALLEKQKLKKMQLSAGVINNHAITHIIPLVGEVPVYDITVEDTHNFIANEICVHNCEPRLLAHFGQVKVLIDGYLADPPVDAHSAVATAANIDRQSGKTLNQALITGAGERKAASMLGRPIQEANAIVSAYFAKMPEIKPLQKKVENVWIQRGFIRSLLGRRCRLDDVRFAYKGLNRVLQVGNADVIKKAMCEVDEYLISEGDATHLLNSVHDALDFQYHPDLEHQYRRSLEIMQDFGPTGQSVFVSVPLIVDEKSGDSWAEATYGKEVVEEQFRKAGARY